MYRDLNDYEILYMVCEKSENDFEILLTKYKPLIYKIVKNYVKTFKKFGFELEDLMQIGYITLFKSAKLYDIYNPVIFYSYFKKSLIKNIASYYRLNTSNKKQVLNKALSYDNEINNTNISYLELMPSDIIENDYSKELIIFKNSMPISLSWVFELFYNGYTKEEISVLLDENLEKVRKDFYKIKEHALTYKYLFFA